MQNEEIVLIGGGGHCKSVIDVIGMEGRFRIAGIVDRKDLSGKEISGVPIIGSDEDIPALVKQVGNFHISIGHIKSNAIRVKLYQSIKALGGVFPNIVSPLAYVSVHAKLGEGSILMHKAFVNAGAVVGRNTIINTGAVVEHDVVIGDHCHISTGAYINGECKIGDHSFVGSNSTCNQCVTVGAHGVIAAGAVITANTEDFGLYAGNPGVFKKKLS